MSTTSYALLAMYGLLDVAWSVYVLLRAIRALRYPTSLPLRRLYIMGVVLLSGKYEKATLQRIEGMSRSCIRRWACFLLFVGIAGLALASIQLLPIIRYLSGS